MIVINEAIEEGKHRFLDDFIKQDIDSFPVLIFLHRGKTKKLSDKVKRHTSMIYSLFNILVADKDISIMMGSKMIILKKGEALFDYKSLEEKGFQRPNVMRSIKILSDLNLISVKMYEDLRDYGIYKIRMNSYSRS